VEPVGIGSGFGNGNNASGLVFRVKDFGSASDFGRRTADSELAGVVRNVFMFGITDSVFGVTDSVEACTLY